MLKLLLIIAYRNFYKDKLTSFIQLAGLVIGIGCYVLIQNYLEYEHSYNTQFTDVNDIYRVNLIRGENKPQTLTPLRLSQELTNNFSGVTDATRISATTISIKHNEGVFAERASFVDQNFFTFFDFQLLEGDLHTALNSPSSVVLHQALAIKYFGRVDSIIGQTLTVNGDEFLVTGVIKKSVTPHTLPETLLLPMKAYFQLLPNLEWTEMWNFNATVTFAKVANSGLIDDLNTRVSDFYDERVKGLSSFKSYRVIIEPMLDVHLNNVTTRPLVPSGSALMVTAFQIISLLILFLACINFTNLATAAAMRKGKDVGVRKAIGASKFQLVCQYLVESLMLTTCATVLALGAVYLCLPWFNQLMNVDISLALDIFTILKLTTITLVVGVLAGSYPAFFLSSLSPAMVLKGVVNTSKTNVLFRQSLIVLQFGAAAFLLVASLIVNWQMQYVQNMPLGYEKDNVLVVSRGASVYNAFKVQAMQLPEVELVTMSHTVPTKATRTSQTVRKAGELDNEVWVGNNPVSYDFFNVYGIKLLAGRGFSKAFTNDAYVDNEDDPTQITGKLIINATLAKTLGWTPDQAIGETLTLGSANEGFHYHQVIGVTEDTHYVDAKNIVPPMIYVLSQEPQDLSLRWLSVQLNQQASPITVKELEKIWLNLNGNSAFKYEWVNDLFSATYRNETQQTKLLNIFTILAFIVTTIGLLGLAAFTTERRVKEIAVRRILGAKTGQLCFMLVNQFTMLIVLANVLALPLVYWQVRDWLNNFIYRIDVPASAFLIGVAVSLVVAYCTILLIAIKAIKAKPVHALSAE